MFMSMIIFMLLFIMPLAYRNFTKYKNDIRYTKT